MVKRLWQHLTNDDLNWFFSVECCKIWSGDFVVFVRLVFLLHSLSFMHWIRKAVNIRLLFMLYFVVILVLAFDSIVNSYLFFCSILKSSLLHRLRFHLCLWFFYSESFFVDSFPCPICLYTSNRFIKLLAVCMRMVYMPNHSHIVQITAANSIPTNSPKNMHIS